MRRSEDIHALVDRAASELGPIDILVNNAGSLVARYGILEITEERLDEIVALNFTSAVLTSQAVAASMIERRRGAIVNVVSIAGHNGGGPGAGLYASSKAALTRSPRRSPRSWRRRASASTPSRRASSTRPSTRCSPRRR